MTLACFPHNQLGGCSVKVKGAILPAVLRLARGVFSNLLPVVRPQRHAAIQSEVETWQVSIHEFPKDPHATCDTCKEVSQTPPVPVVFRTQYLSQSQPLRLKEASQLISTHLFQSSSSAAGRYCLAASSVSCVHQKARTMPLDLLGKLSHLCKNRP